MEGDRRLHFEIKFSYPKEGELFTLRRMEGA